MCTQLPVGTRIHLTIFLQQTSDEQFSMDTVSIGKSSKWTKFPMGKLPNRQNVQWAKLSMGKIPSTEEHGCLLRYTVFEKLPVNPFQKG